MGRSLFWGVDITLYIWTLSDCVYNSHLCIFLLFSPAAFQPTSLTNKKKISLFIHLHTHLCLHNQSTIPSSYVLFPWDSHDYEVFWVNVLKLRPYQSWDPDYDVLLCVTTPIWSKSQDFWDGMTGFQNQAGLAWTSCQLTYPAQLNTALRKHSKYLHIIVYCSFVRVYVPTCLVY